MRSVFERFEEKLVKSNGCWQWIASKFPSGYGQFWLAGTQHTAHRISFDLYIGPVPEDLFVCHSCDNYGCVNPDHLFLGSQLENMADMKRKGRQGRRGSAFRLPGHSQGERNSSAKLTKDQVLAIRQDTRTQQAIANEYGVCQVTISAIKSRLTWSHI
jgi:hypothetical protein